MRLLIAAILAVLVSGCSKKQPSIAGGKPVSFLVQELQDPDALRRKAAVLKLGNRGPVDPTAFPAVLGALKDADARVRFEAILAILKFGPDAKKAIPVLTEVQEQDTDGEVRSSATKALAKLQASK